MAETSGPWSGTSPGDAGPYSDQEWALFQEYAFGYGASRANNGIFRGNGTFSGATYTESLEVTQTAPASAAISLNPGSAMVDGEFYINDSALTMSIAANASGNSRIDTIILRKIVAAQTVRAVVLQGTPAASPVPTALTQTIGVQWEIPIAYVTAASGFVTITNSVISPAGYNANVPDSIEIDVYNNSGSTLVTGTVVRIDITANQAITLNSVPSAFLNLTVGVWRGRTANGAWGKCVMSGIAFVRTSGTVQVGDWLRSTGSTGLANVITSPISSTGPVQPVEGTFAKVLIGTSGAGLALCQIFPALVTHYQQMAQTQQLSGAAASISRSSIFTGYGLNFELELILQLRSAVAATTDTALIRFGSASTLDTTATNYYSEHAAFGGPTPTAAAVENLGAVAGIQVTIPGATALADAFGYIRLNVTKNPAGTFYVVNGSNAYQIGNLTVNIVAAVISGRWLGTAADIDIVGAVATSGSNFVSGSKLVINGRKFS